MRKYEICIRCVMDTSDLDIVFNSDRTCNHCESYFQRKKEFIYGDKSNKLLEDIVNKVKIEGKGKKYDCLIGISGGVDSTYVAYLVNSLGLKPLAIHLDNGWNSDLAVSNIEKTLNKLDIDLFTYIIDWEEFRDLQISFLKSSIPGMEVPTDHAITAILYQTAIKFNIKNIILGANKSSELIMASGWSEVVAQRDWKLIKNIQKQFGSKKLKTFPHFKWTDWYYYLGLKRIKVISILDYINYSKDEAMKILQAELDWEYYGGKHYESIYTRFTQGYIQPVKFDFDKRRAHYSNLICRGDISREGVLEILSESPYPNEEMLREDTEYFKRKLDLSDSEFNEIMNLKVKTYKDYNGYYNSWFHLLLRKIIFKIHFYLKSVRNKKS